MTVLGGINMGDLTDFLFVFLNGSIDANWQGATKGYIGDVAVNGLIAAERTSGSVPYAGTIFTNAPTLGAWQAIIDQNPTQASESLNQVALLTQKQIDFDAAWAQINSLPATPGFESVDSSALDGLNFQNGICETIVINVTSGFTISQELHIWGDACDTIVIRWDYPTYANIIKFQSGGAVVPEGGLIPSNFINTAGDINASGGGTTPPPPYPQGPRYDNGLGPLIIGGTDFSGGGFFTGYWLTIGDPATGETQPLSNAIFVGGWYTTTTKFSMTSGTSGVYVAPPLQPTPCLTLQKFISVDGGLTFVSSPTAPGVTVPFGTNPIFRYFVTNCGSTELTGITLTDSVLGSITIPVTTLASGASFEAFANGTCAVGQQGNNVATVQGFSGTTPLTATSQTFYVCAAEPPPPCISLQKFISVDGGLTFVPSPTAPGVAVPFGVNPIFRYLVTNCGSTVLTGITLTDSVLGTITTPVTTLAPGASFDAFANGTCAVGQQGNNVATVQGFSGTTPLTATSQTFYVCAAEPPPPCISLQKFISVDGGLTFVPSPTPPGVTVPFGTSPVFRYLVTNCGTTELTSITLTDSVLGAITIPMTTLAAGASFEAFATGACAVGQQGNNVATVQGFSGTTPLTATSQTFYVCAAPPPPCISLQKFISVDGGLTFVPSPTAPGVTVPFGVSPMFRYFVTNCGSTELTGITLNDSVLGAITIPVTTLAAGASFEAFAMGACTAGQLGNNVATVQGFSGTTLLTATSQTFYVCAAPPPPGIAVQKLISVNGGATFVPAPPPGVLLPSPTNPQYRFIITNTGGSTITGVTVVDTTFGPITLPTTTLLPGQSITVTLPGVFALGQHCNTVTVTGIATGGVPLTATASACFRGFTPPVPVFPPLGPPAPQNQIIDRLLETIALEELALAGLVNAEAEKVQAVSAAGIMGPVDAEDVAAINASVAGVINQAAAKEANLRRKLSAILAHKATFPEQCPVVCPPPPPAG